eukprot:5334884-Ditylum_brightwellii.AAC.1
MLKTTDHKRTVKFLMKGTELLKQLDVEQCLQKLTKRLENDGDTVRALLLNYPPHSWTVEIHHASLLINYWVAEQSFKRNRMGTLQDCPISNSARHVNGEDRHKQIFLLSARRN